MCSTFVLNTLAIFSARMVEGINFPNSMALIVCLETFTFSANSACVILYLALSTLIEFFMLLAGCQELYVK